MLVGVNRTDRSEAVRLRHVPSGRDHQEHHGELERLSQANFGSHKRQGSFNVIIARR